MDNLYYILEDKTPKAVSLQEWAVYFGTANRSIGKDQFGDVTVSTVFLGMNHTYGEGKPLLFETMIFGGEHDDYQERYSTYDEALVGHQRAIQLVTNKS